MSDPEGRDSLHSAAENRAMFGQVARRYDLLNRVLSLGLDGGWRRRAIAMLAPQPGGRYLDIGCGSGDMMLEIAAQEPDAAVCGIDPVAGMLELAGDKLRGAGHEGAASLQVADAAELPFAAGSFDGITCAFCIRNVEHRVTVFREMVRVLQRSPGRSRAVILELTEPTGLALRLLHRCYGLVWVPLVGALLSRGTAYRYLVRSIRSFPRSEQLLQEMSEAGFAETRATPLNGGIVTLFTGRC